MITIDFETYSEAGYDITPNSKGGYTVSAPNGSGKSGIELVGAAVYAEHPSTEVLCLAYNLHDGQPTKLWEPTLPPPVDLFAAIAEGQLVEAHNSMFEFYIWHFVCHSRMKWPAAPIDQFRCSASKSRSFSIPAALSGAGKVLKISNQKLSEGKELIQKYCRPRTTTKSQPSVRRYLSDNTTDRDAMYRYCIRDVDAEMELSSLLPDLVEPELSIWKIDQKVNARGVQIDRPALESFIRIAEQHDNNLTNELFLTTSGAVTSASEIDKNLEWLASRNCPMPSFDKEAIAEALKNPLLPPDVRRVLEIRQSLSMASVKKLYSIQSRLNSDGRVRDNFVYHGADTGRWAGRGVQPQNLPSGGPVVDGKEWSAELAEKAINLALTVGDVSSMGDPMHVISGCIRGLIIPRPGYDLVCADYSAIEAVVLSFLAGEQWRMEVFRTHGKIYEMSAAKITGIPFEEFIEHKKRTGEHHPQRKKVGKVAELASGYQGGAGAWLKFGADKHLAADIQGYEHMSPDMQKKVMDEYIWEKVRKWRAESPMVVKFWEMMETCARSAIQTPGMEFAYNGITFYVWRDVLFCRLLSGRTLKYHQPRLVPGKTPFGKDVLKITYMGVDSKTKRWVRQDTYGGKLTENVVQAVSRDILAHAEMNIDAHPLYDLVLHVHDEAVAEVPEGHGSVEEFEGLMNDLPSWCKDWPVRAAGGWRGKRYKKD